MKTRSFLAALLLSLLVQGAAAGAREAECVEGEGPELLAARAQWYIATFGVNGVFDPQRKLEALRASYAEYLRERARRRPEAIGAGAFRFVGPANGAGRAPAVEPHPTDPNVVYVGAAGGGCWKSTDGGATWRALTDGLGDLSVGAVAIAPSNPSVVYLGSGEGGYAGDFVPGVGVFRSTDAGETWTLPPFVASPFVYRLSVDPREARTLLAMTHDGALLSTDGGTSFAPASDSGWGDAVDVVRDPTNPDVVHATFWRFYAPEETGRYARSTDGGRTWREVVTGLPVGSKGRMSLAISSDGRTLYTLIAGPYLGPSQVGLYRSDDGGASWQSQRVYDPAARASVDVLGGQGGYDNTVAVDPDDSRVVLLGGGRYGQWRSTDGGDTVTRVGQADGVHVDVHQLVFQRYGAAKVAWSANDGGVWSSTDGGFRWLDRNTGLATRQYYAAALDATRADVRYAGSQDNGTDRSGSAGASFAPASGGDGFECAVDPDAPATVYTSAQFASVFRSTGDGARSSFAYLARPFAGQAFSRNGGDGVKPFFTRLLLDPDDRETVYTGTYRVWRSGDRGVTWAPLSSDGFSQTAEVRALAAARGRLLVAQGSRLFLSTDRGRTFLPLPSFTPAGAILSLEIDPRSPDVFWAATASISARRTPGIFRSTDAGTTWAERSTGLPDFAAPVVRVDPTDSRTVYAGTLVGLYRTTDDGRTWARFGDGLPAVAVFDVRIPPDGSRILVATHGRGLWEAEAPGGNRPPAVAIESPASDVAVAAGAAVSFAGRAVDPDGDAIASYRWELGDGMSSSASATGAVVYRTPGLYRVSLVAADAKGARGVAFVTVTVLPPNDACSDATPVALVPGTTVGLRTGNGGARTTDPSDPPTCSDPAISNSVWFTVTPPVNGTLELDTFGSAGDTVMAAFAGDCGSLGAALSCNDDADGVSGGPSQLGALTVLGGKPYRVLVASWSDASRGYVGPVESLRVNARFTPVGDDAPTAGTAALLPVVLDAYGKNDARFQSDLTLLNSGASPLVVALTYTSGAVSGTSSVTLAPGSQVRVADALAELRREGIAIPRTTPDASQVGSLTALVASGDPRSLVLSSRVATPNPNAGVGGSFGTFAPGVPFEEAADGEAVTIHGLRQTERDRSNLALVHVRTPHPANAGAISITLVVEVFDAVGRAGPKSPLTVTLAEGEWTQLGEVLTLAGLDGGAADGGWARVRRTSGAGRFFAYGVVNDQKTADGSIVPMTKSGRMRAADTLLVPVVLEAAGLQGSFFTTELVLASGSARAGTATLRYVPSPLFSGTIPGSVTLPIGAASQLVLPDLVHLLRARGVAIPEGSPQGGALFVTFDGLAPEDDVYAGVRIATPNPDRAEGGAFGVFLPALPGADLAEGSAVIPGLRRDGSARANLAVVNGGASPITLSVSLRSPVDGTPHGSTLTRTLGPGEWYQFSNVFALAGLGDGEAWAVVTRTAGQGRWWAYGVLNDEKTSDGSVIPAIK